MGCRGLWACCVQSHKMKLKNHLQVLCLHVLGQNMMVGDIVYDVEDQNAN